MAKQTLLESKGDIAWFFKTHLMLKSAPAWCKGVLLHGNEDAPDAADIYGKYGMEYSDVGPVYTVKF